MSANVPSGTGIASPEGLFKGRLVYNQPHTGFRSSVDSLALIYFVQDHLAHTPNQICDIGCGSGFLALMSGLLWPNAEIVGVELSPQRASFARQNAAANQMQDRLTIIEADIKALQPPESGYDLILANPPYHQVSSGTLPKDPDNARARFEVELDLATLLMVAKESLSDDGFFYLVFPIKRWPDLVRTTKESDMCVVHHRRVRPTASSEPFLVLAALRNLTTDNMPEALADEEDLILETADKRLGLELNSFVAKMSKDAPTLPNNEENGES